MADDNNYDQGKSLDDRVGTGKARLQGITLPGPTFQDAMDHYVIKDYHSGSNGTIDPRKMKELEGRYGYNGLSPCDVLEGPCSCGAWHHKLSGKDY